MKNNLITMQAERLLKELRYRRKWKRYAAVLSCFVVVLTISALMLPAITLNAADCGEEEHIHTTECYVPGPAGVVCEPVHVHDDSCKDAAGALVCRKADFVVHTHDGQCYDAEGALQCSLPEIKVHAHDDTCRSAEEIVLDEGHTHTDACFTMVSGTVPTCDLKEGMGHTHEDSCKAVGTELICGQEEIAGHGHGDDCYGYITRTVCTDTTPEHVHGENCYAPVRELTCTLEEVAGHTHGEGCHAQPGAIICGEEEAPFHIHTEACNGMVRGEQICTETEREKVIQPGELKLICEKAELALHTHTTPACYVEVTNGENTEVFWTCTLEEVTEHKHTEACWGTPNVLECTITEHVHTDICYDEVPLSEEELKPVEDVISIISGLPPAKEIEDELLRLKVEGDTEGLKLYQEKMFAAITDAVNSYDALSSKQQRAVTNRELLGDYRALLYSDEEEELPVVGDSFEAVSEDGQITASVVTEGTLPAGAVFEITTAASQSDAFSSTIDRAQSFLKNNSVKSVDMLAMDMHFKDANGVEIQPGGQTQVTLKFAEPILPGDYGHFLLHFTEKGPEFVEHTTESTEAGVTSITFKTDGFSMYVAGTNEKVNQVLVTAVNSFEWDWVTNGSGSFQQTSVICRDSSGTKTVLNKINANLPYWTATTVRKVGNFYQVTAVKDKKGENKGSVVIPSDGFVLLTHDDFGGSLQVSVGDKVYINNTSWQTNSSKGPYATGYSIVTIMHDDVDKPAKNNNLTPIASLSTADFVDINLYDYGTGSAGSNINDKFVANSKYPGFQQSGGSKTIRYITSTGSMNFGDIITDDRNAKDGMIVTNGATGINQVRDSANSPISRYSDVMHEELIDGYPALADGTSLKYLFSSNTYAKKMNTANIDGLFKSDGAGGYVFNSREDFAQYSNNRFTLYDQILTPNYIMYPFGNFMPFQNINTQATQVSTINRSYFDTMRKAAQYDYVNTGDTQYGQLASVLEQFISLADDAWGTSWDAERTLQNYFGNVGELPDDGGGSRDDSHLQNMYNLDYDEDSDFYFGMDMSMTLMQPKGGLTGPNGDQTMYFYFTGDDDVWVYLDGKLVLDLSGIHRHVGGAIDFSKGAIMYFPLDVTLGDVGTTADKAYKIVYFEDIWDKDTELQANGVKLSDPTKTAYTFKDYSLHKFNFYYMERGSGSSICRINFNFPLLRENSISVTKRVTADNAQFLAGDPDFTFAVYKYDDTLNGDAKYTNIPFVAANTRYTVLDSYGNVVADDRYTDSNGFFTIKDGQTAVFDDIKENAGKYYVQEILFDDVQEQYGDVQVDVNGSTEISDSYNGDILGVDSFKGVRSTPHDMSEGATTFTFDNTVNITKLAKLDILKTAESAFSTPEELSQKVFEFDVRLDGVKLPVGATYNIYKYNESTDSYDATGEVRKVTADKPGIVWLRANEKARIDNILAGSTYTVEEITDGYVVSYTGDGQTVRREGEQGGAYFTGEVKLYDGTEASVVKAAVHNVESGINVPLPVVKLLPNYDGMPRRFTFDLVQITGLYNTTPVVGGTMQTVHVDFGEEVVTSMEHAFQLSYPAYKTVGTQTFYYKVTENSANGSPYVVYDTGEYIAQVTITKAAGGEMTSQVTLYKDGTALTDGEKMTFQNLLLADLSISKRLVGVTNPDAVFTFKITLTNGDQPLVGIYDTQIITSSTTADPVVGALSLDATGTGSLQLHPGQQVSIMKLPVGTSWSITELNTDGYAVYHKVGTAEENTAGDTVSGVLPSGGSAVQYINETGYELPTTGGPGTWLFTLGGVALMLTAGVMLILQYKKRKGAAEY